MGRRSRLATDANTSTNGPVRAAKADPLAWSRALTLADDDARRLVVGDDGSVLVLRQAAPGRRRPRRDDKE